MEFLDFQYHWKRVEVKDVRLPYNFQRAMAAEAEASREAKAKVWFQIVTPITHSDWLPGSELTSD